LKQTKQKRNKLSKRLIFKFSTLAQEVPYAQYVVYDNTYYRLSATRIAGGVSRRLTGVNGTEAPIQRLRRF
jgi:hypothetical protein